METVRTGNNSGQALAAEQLGSSEVRVISSLVAHSACRRAEAFGRVEYSEVGCVS